MSDLDRIEDIIEEQSDRFFENFMNYCPKFVPIEAIYYWSSMNNFVDPDSLERFLPIGYPIYSCPYYSDDEEQFDVKFASSPNMTIELFKKYDMFKEGDGFKLFINNPKFTVRELCIATGKHPKLLLEQITNPRFEKEELFIEALVNGYLNNKQIAMNSCLNDDIFRKLDISILSEWKTLIYNTGLSAELVIEILLSPKIKDQLYHPDNDLFNDFAQIMQHPTKSLMVLNKRRNELIDKQALEKGLDNMCMD